MEKIFPKGNIIRFPITLNRFEEIKRALGTPVKMVANKSGLRPNYGERFRYLLTQGYRQFLEDEKKIATLQFSRKGDEFIQIYFGKKDRDLQSALQRAYWELKDKNDVFQSFTEFVNHIFFLGWQKHKREHNL